MIKTIVGGLIGTRNNMFWETIVAVLGVVMSLGHFPQAYRIWQKKDAEDVSITTFGVFAVGSLVWTIYGIVLHDLVIIAGFIFGVVGSWTVLALTIYYRFVKKKVARATMPRVEKREKLD